MADTLPRKMWCTYALLEYGGRGLGPVRKDPTRVGIVEVTDRIRWIPQRGEGWSFPLSAVSVVTPKALLGLIFEGLDLELPGIGPIRLRVMNFAPNTPLALTDRATGDASATGRLRKKMVRRGALVTAAP